MDCQPEKAEVSPTRVVPARDDIQFFSHDPHGEGADKLLLDN